MEVLGEGKHLRLVKEGRWEFAERTSARGAVVIVAVTQEGKLLLVEQFRMSLQQNVIELPAGLVGDEAGAEEEELREAAHRELLEETGYQATELTLATVGPPSAGLSNELTALFLASGLHRTQEGGGTEHEQIVVHEVALSEAHQWLEDQHRHGRLIDPKIYAGLYFCRTGATQF